MSRIVKVVQDYLGMGVPTVWVLDPLEKKAYAADLKSGLHEVRGKIFTTDGRVLIDLADVFSEQDLF